VLHEPDKPGWFLPIAGLIDDNYTSP
jgi:hypothetical protein